MMPRNRTYPVVALAVGAAIATTALAQQLAAPVGSQAAVQEMAVQDMTGQDMSVKSVAAASNSASQLRVGTAVDMASLHRISRPGLYGMSQSPQGSSYGILGGRLIRYDPETLRVQSIIREVDEILD